MKSISTNINTIFIVFAILYISCYLYLKKIFFKLLIATGDYSLKAMRLCEQFQRKSTGGKKMDFRFLWELNDK